MQKDLNIQDVVHSDKLFEVSVLPDAGDQFIGSYRLVRVLGSGGFASVYLGEHHYLKRLAAIKILRTVLSDQDKEYFLKEARLLASLSHPHIVRVLEFAVTQRIGRQGGTEFTEYIPYLVMDFAPGDSLRIAYPAGSCLFLNTVVSYVKQIAAALQYAHDRGIIHRDVKPENCLLNERQEVMLSDFGLALFVPAPSLLSTQHIAGTLPYTAPEQLRGKPEFASDQYSLAIIAYEWLCGQRPFGGEDVSIIVQHIYSPPPSLRDQNSAISAAIEGVIMKALAKDPNQRYPTIQAFADALEAACMQEELDFSTASLAAVRIFPSRKQKKSVVTESISVHTDGDKSQRVYARIQTGKAYITERRSLNWLREIQLPSFRFPQRGSTSLYILLGCVIALFLMVGSSLWAMFLFQNARVTAFTSSWHLIWSDEFNGAAGTGVNQANWLYDTGTSYPNGAMHWGTGEVESMSNRTVNVFQDGAGHLAIKPIREDGHWTSGRIETQRSNFTAPVGGEIAIQASIRLPNVIGAAALGYWPSLSLLGAPYRGDYHNWPRSGEVDIMENINGFNHVGGTLHCGVASGGACDEPFGLGGQGTCHVITCQGGFHTYRVEYDRSTSPEQIRWYLDGVLFWQVSANLSGIDAASWANALHHSFFILLMVAMGGNFPASAGGGPTSTTISGAPLLIDYIRVYTMNGSTRTAAPTV